jgi:hypothetical protein
MSKFNIYLLVILVVLTIMTIGLFIHDFIEDSKKSAKK